MSRGDLQEMEQSRTAVNANATPNEPMHRGPDELTPGSQTPGNPGASYEDLGGPTVENASPTNDSGRLREPKIKTVHDVVNKNAKGNEPMDTSTKKKYVAGQGTGIDNSDDKKIGHKAYEEAEYDEDVLEEEELTSEVSIEDDVHALLGGEELSEEFREKAKIIFEAALNSKVKEIQEALEIQFAERLVSETETMKEELVSRVDSYLEYVAEEWMTENELAIEHGLKTEMTESFLSGMKTLFEDHYVTIPEDKYDVLETMVDKLDDMESKLNEQIEKNIGLNQRLGESISDHVLESVSEGLAQTQKEKLASLAESVEFESEEEYREKLETLRESYFSKGPAPARVTLASQQTLSEGYDSTAAPTKGGMESYIRAMGNFGKS